MTDYYAYPMTMEAFDAMWEGEDEESTFAVHCAVCGLPIVGDDYHNRHSGHEDYCPRHGEDPDDPRDDIDCICDVNYHAECCPDCKGEVVM